MAAQSVDPATLRPGHPPLPDRWHPNAPRVRVRLGIGELALRYTVILENDPTGMIVAHVPALRGCVSQGRTKREALRNVKEAIALYILWGLLT